MKTILRLGEIVRRIEKNEYAPLEAGYDRFVKVEHMDTDDLKIHRWGSIKNDLFPPTFHKVFRKGQILFPTRNPHLRRVVVADFDGICGEKTLTLSPIENRIEPNLVAFLLQSDSFVQHCVNSIIGSTNPHVRWRDIAEYKIALPERAVQKKIAETLGSIESNKERLEQLVQISEKLKKGLLEELLTKGVGHTKFKQTEIGEIPENWEAIPLVQVCNGATQHFLDGDWVLSKDLDEMGDVRLIQLGNIGEGKFNDDSKKWISSQKLKELDFTLLKPGDILVSRMADPICRSCILPSFGYQCITAVDVAIVRSNDSDFDRDFVNYLFNSKIVLFQAQPFSAGATRPRISRKNLERIIVPKPPIQEQKKVASILSRVDEAIQRTDEMIAKTQQLKKRLTDSFLSGELLIPKEVMN